MNLFDKKQHFFVSRIIFTILILVFSSIQISNANMAKSQYQLAEKLYDNFNKQIEHHKYREKWLLCINEFNKVYTLNPDGPCAAVGLYKSGILYVELYKRSKLDLDLIEAIDIFNRINKRFPKSFYSTEATILLKEIYEKEKNKLIYVNSEERLKLATLAFKKLMKDHDQQKDRNAWIKVISLYNDIYENKPNSELLPEILFTMGNLYLEVHLKFLKDTDKIRSDELFIQLQTKFPKNLFTQKSINIMHNSNKSDINSKEVNKFVTIDNIIVSSTSKNSKIILYLDKETSYIHNFLSGKLETNNSHRFYVDLHHSKLGKNINSFERVDDKFIECVKVDQFVSDVVRILVDIKSFVTYKIFALKNPFRIVIDIKKEKKVISDEILPLVNSDSIEELPKDAMVRQLSLGVGKIVIDPGHGGKDYGAIGALKGIYEKDIVLEIANCLAGKIRSKLGCKVIMTRKDDCYLSLEDRTAIANNENADLFISIHTNAAENKKAHGIETFFLDLATDTRSVHIAARENAMTTKKISDLESILKGLLKNSKINESSKLALNIQNNICSNAKNKYNEIFDKGVKQAPFYVLMGAEMPAVLVETSFISNDRECKRLRKVEYQETICDGIVMGIENYIRSNKTILVSK